jgi:hypothetical protein
MALIILHNLKYNLKYLKLGLHLHLEEALNQSENKFENGLRKRFACSQCGKTWVEIVGLFTGHMENQENVYFRLGEESEACQNCRYRSRTCPACASKDVYEINFPTSNPESPLSFNRIRIVSNTRESSEKNHV